MACVLSNTHTVCKGMSQRGYALWCHVSSWVMASVITVGVRQSYICHQSFFESKHQILNVIVMQILQYNSGLLLKHYCRNTNRNCTFAVVELLCQCKQLDIRITRCIGINLLCSCKYMLSPYYCGLQQACCISIVQYHICLGLHLKQFCRHVNLELRLNELYHPVGLDSPNNMVWCMSTCQRGRKWMGWQGVKVLQFSTVFCFPYNSTPRSQAKERQ